jgi:antitoxin CptB
MGSDRFAEADKVLVTSYTLRAWFTYLETVLSPYSPPGYPQDTIAMDGRVGEPGRRDLNGRRAMSNEGDLRRKRLLFRSRRRGTRETDLLLGHFAERCLGTLSDDQLDRYEALLERTDRELFDWILDRESPPPECDNDVLKLMRDFKQSRLPN